MTSPGPAGSPARPRSRWADLAPRLLSAGVIIAVIAIALYFGGWVYAVVIGITFGILYREWEQMITLAPLGPFGMVLIGLLVVAALAYPLYGAWGTIAVMAVVIVVSALGGRAVAPWRVGGLIFFAAALLASLAMRADPSLGLVAGWYLGITIALNDTGAFFVGRLIGGRKLAPTISPGKTWSGAIGGLIIGTLAGTIYWAIFVPSAWWIGFGLSFAMGLLGQVGDLAESAIKRLFRIKDSGDIIPGHGGFMDRLDSVSFGVLFFFAVGALHAGIGSVAAGFFLW